MVVLTTFSQPTNGIRHQQPNTTVFVNDNNLGKGTLFIAESCLSWVSDSGNGFSLEYPHISLHAISRDLSAFPQECLFLMLDTAIGDEENNEEEDNENEVDETEEQVSTELRLVPDDRGMLDAMFHAMNACQALHPDPEDSFSDEDFYEDADDEIPMDETDSRMAGLRIENMDGRQHMVGERGVGILGRVSGRGTNMGEGGIGVDLGRNMADLEGRVGGTAGSMVMDLGRNMADLQGRVGGTAGGVVVDREVGTEQDILFYRGNGMAQGDRSFSGGSIQPPNTMAHIPHPPELHTDLEDSNFDDVEN